MLIKHSIIYFFSKGLPAIINFFGIIIYTRIVSPDDYGIYSLTIVYVGLFNAITFQWIRSSLLRFWQSENILKQKLQATIVFTYTLIMIINLIIMVALINLNITRMSFLIGAFLLLLFQSWFELNLTLLRAKLLPKLFGYVTLVKTIFAFLFSLLLIYLGFTETGLVFGLALGFFIGCLLTIYQWKSINIKSVELNLIKEIFKFGVPVSMSISFGILVFGTDRIILSINRGLSDAGVYSVSFDFTQQTILLIMSVINLAAYPLALKTFELKGENEAKKQLDKNFNLMIIVSIPATIGLLILSDQVVNLFFGEEFREIGKLILPLISIAAFLNGIKSYYFDLAFQLKQKTYLQIYPIMIAVLLNLCLNLVFIPKWGVVGAAYTSIISYFLALIISVVLGRRIIKMPIDLVMLIKVIFSTVLMSIIIKFLNINLFLSIVSGVISYFTILYLINDKKNVNNIIKKILWRK